MGVVYYLRRTEPDALFELGKLGWHPDVFVAVRDAFAPPTPVRAAFPDATALVAVGFREPAAARLIAWADARPVALVTQEELIETIYRDRDFDDWSALVTGSIYDPPNAASPSGSASLPNAPAPLRETP